MSNPKDAEGENMAERVNRRRIKRMLNRIMAEERSRNRDLGRYPPRPMTGFWATLTAEQQAKVLGRRAAALAELAALDGETM